MNIIHYIFSLCLSCVCLLVSPQVVKCAGIKWYPYPSMLSCCLCSPLSLSCNLWPCRNDHCALNDFRMSCLTSARVAQSLSLPCPPRPLTWPWTPIERMEMDSGRTQMFRLFPGPGASLQVRHSFTGDGKHQYKLK